MDKTGAYEGGSNSSLTGIHQLQVRHMLSSDRHPPITSQTYAIHWQASTNYKSDICYPLTGIHQLQVRHMLSSDRHPPITSQTYAIHWQASTNYKSDICYPVCHAALC